MDGSEDSDELDRCRIFDKLHRAGPQTIGELIRATGIHGNRMRHLVKECFWFDWDGEFDGKVRIAKTKGNLD